MDCGKKRNCVELEGMYDCNRGHCSRINKVSREVKTNPSLMANPARRGFLESASPQKSLDHLTAFGAPFISIA